MSHYWPCFLTTTAPALGLSNTGFLRRNRISIDFQCEIVNAVFERFYLNIGFAYAFHRVSQETAFSGRFLEASLPASVFDVGIGKDTNLRSADANVGYGVEVFWSESVTLSTSERQPNQSYRMDRALVRQRLVCVPPGTRVLRYLGCSPRVLLFRPEDIQNSMFVSHYQARTVTTA